MWNGSTEDLFKLARQGKYLKEISYDEVRRGDIFVKGKEGASGGAYGHTMVPPKSCTSIFLPTNI